MEEGACAKRLWSVAAAEVLLEHFLLRRPDCLGEFRASALSWWVAQLLAAAPPEALEELRAHGIWLSCSGTDADACDDVVVSVHVSDGAVDEGAEPSQCPQRLATADDLKQALGRVCEPLESLQLDWLGSLQATVQVAGAALQESMGGWLDVSGLSDLRVDHACMFGEDCKDWATPYETAWQADGAAKCITMPDVPHFEERHFEHFAERMGHRSHGQTLLFEYLGTLVIPCHEVIHIVQHLHGHLNDADPQSYAMEHDASRLNFVLLWQVVQRLDGIPAWAKWVVMLEGLNRSLWAETRIPSGPAYEAYRKWAGSFGLESPSSVFKTFGDVEAFRLESAVKCLVAGEALIVASLPPCQEDIDSLLRAAFDPGRSGDVYSSSNRELVASLLPEHLRLDCSARGRLLERVADPELLQGAISAVRKAYAARMG